MKPVSTAGGFLVFANPVVYLPQPPLARTKRTTKGCGPNLMWKRFLLISVDVSATFTAFGHVEYDPKDRFVLANPAVHLFDFLGGGDAASDNQ